MQASAFWTFIADREVCSDIGLADVVRSCRTLLLSSGEACPSCLVQPLETIAHDYSMHCTRLAAFAAISLPTGSTNSAWMSML